MSEKKSYEFSHPELLRALTESGDGLAVFHPDWRYVYADEIAAKLFGGDPDDIIGKYVYEVCPIESRNFSCQVQKRAMAERTSLISEDYFSTVDRWYRTYCHPMENGNLLVLFHDLTQERRANEAREHDLLTALERYERIIEGTDSGIWEWECPTNEWYRSTQWKALLGYTDDEMPTSEPPEELSFPEDREMVRQALEDFSMGLLSRYRVEYRLRHKDGSYRWILSRATATRYPDGTAHLVSGIYTDITERKAIEERLRLLESAVVHANDAIIITEAEAVEGRGRPILYVNEAFSRMTGYSAEEAEGTSLTLLQGTDTDPQTLSYIRAQQTLGEGFRVELKSQRKDNTPFWTEVNVQPVRNLGGHVTHWINVQRDITERKKAEEYLAAEAERQEHIANTLQQSLLRRPNSGTTPGLEVSPLYQAALQEARVGGDFFDVFALPDGRVALIVGDVMGKGLTAAEVTGEVKFTLRHVLHEEPDPAAALAHLNRYRIERQELDPPALDAFVCLTVAVFDSRTGRVRFAVAGSEAPLIVRAATGMTEAFPGGGLPVGILPDWSQDADNVDCYLDEGDLLLLYTDGLTEARNEVALNQFGVEGIVNAIERAKRDSDPDTIADTILSAARLFAHGSLKDDVCLLIARCLPTS